MLDTATLGARGLQPYAPEAATRLARVGLVQLDAAGVRGARLAQLPRHLNAHLVAAGRGHQEDEPLAPPETGLEVHYGPG